MNWQQSKGQDFVNIITGNWELYKKEHSCVNNLGGFGLVLVEIQ